VLIEGWSGHIRRKGGQFLAVKEQFLVMARHPDLLLLSFRVAGARR